MTHTQGEILYALKVIQNTCKEQPDCCCCPFRGQQENDVACMLSCTPDNWRIKKEAEEPWRAFQ